MLMVVVLWILKQKKTFLLFKICMLGNFYLFFCGLLTVFHFKKFYWKTIRVTNGLDPDQDLCSVGPGQGPNCLQRLSAEDKSCS